MIRKHALQAAILSTAISSSLFAAVDLASYRGFQFGATVAAAAKHAGVEPADVKVIHKAPAVIQEIDWQLRSQFMDAKPDPVKEGLLSFYNGELSRIVITYDRYKIEGMTTDDMVDAISSTYGPATKPKAEVPYHSNYSETAPVLARWESPEYSYDLVRTGDQGSYALVLYSKKLDALAQAANIEAVRLEAMDAPKREMERIRKREEDERLALEKTRSANKPNFRP